MQSNMSTANKSFKNMLTVTLIMFMCLLSYSNALLTNTKTLEGMKTNLYSKLNSFPGLGKNLQMKEIMSELIEMSKQDHFEMYQRTSFDILITKTRELVDGMLEEQRDEDIQFRNVTNLLMKYHIRQEHALEVVTDKHQLSQYFLEFVASIDQTEGKIDIKTDYSKMLSILLVLQNKYMMYSEAEKEFSEKFAKIYDGLNTDSVALLKVLSTNENPYFGDQMKKLATQLEALKTGTQAVVKTNYLYNVNPDLEIEMIQKYVTYFQKQSKNETRTITPHFFPSFEKQEKEAKDEILVLSGILANADEALKITTDSIQSNYDEYHQNMKSRKDVVEVIYQILALMNKRAKKIKGYQLAYIEEIRGKFSDFEDSYEFNSYKKYVFKTPPAAEIMNKTMPQLPAGLEGVEDKNAQAPVLKPQVPLNRNATASNVTSF
jgi:hypothetical protein